MIGRLTLVALEWSAAVIAVLAAVSAAGSLAALDMAIAGVAAIAAAQLRAIAISRAAGRRFDHLLSALRAATLPSNDTGGLS